MWGRLGAGGSNLVPRLPQIKLTKQFFYCCSTFHSNRYSLSLSLRLYLANFPILVVASRRIFYVTDCLRVIANKTCKFIRTKRTAFVFLYNFIKTWHNRKSVLKRDVLAGNFDNIMTPSCNISYHIAIRIYLDRKAMVVHVMAWLCKTQFMVILVKGDIMCCHRMTQAILRINWIIKQFYYSNVSKSPYWP